MVTVTAERLGDGVSGVYDLREGIPRAVLAEGGGWGKGNMPVLRFLSTAVLLLQLCRTFIDLFKLPSNTNPKPTGYKFNAGSEVVLTSTEDLLASFTCFLEYELYPFDTQVCEFNISLVTRGPWKPYFNKEVKSVDEACTQIKESQHFTYWDFSESS